MLSPSSVRDSLKRPARFFYGVLQQASRTKFSAMAHRFRSGPVSSVNIARFPPTDAACRALHFISRALPRAAVCTHSGRETLAKAFESKKKKTLCTPVAITSYAFQSSTFYRTTDIASLPTCTVVACIFATQ